jgi:hypothetical protein
MAKITIKVNPNAAKELAKQIEKNLKKKGISGKLPDAEVRKLQQQFNRLGH